MVKRDALKKYIKEKVLLYGDTDTGKTYTAVKLSEFLVQQGKSVVFIDPEFGSHRELVKLPDEILEGIDLRVVRTYPEFRDACLEDSDCFLKIVDGLSEGMEIHKRFLEDKFIAQGEYVVGEKSFKIQDKDTFTLPWQTYAKLYDDLKGVVYRAIQHRYHFVMTMHPFKATETKTELMQSIMRKFDTVLELRRDETSEGGVNRYGVIKKNRGTDVSNCVLSDVAEVLINKFKEVIS